MEQIFLKPVKMLATGAYQPGDPVPFDDIERYLGEFENIPDTMKRMIRSFKPRMKSMLGMDYYYYSINPETRETTESIVGMATKASKRAIEKAGIEPDEIELIVFAGALMERLVCPPTSPMIQAELGIKRCGEMAIHSNCTATYKAMQVAFDAIRLGRYKTALVVSSTIPSQIFRKEFYNEAKVTLEQAILRWFLCDGAGAMILQADDDYKDGIYLMGTYLESIGPQYDPHMYTQFASSNINLLYNYENGLHHLNQDLRQVAALGGPLFLDGSVRMMKDFNLKAEDITYFLANIPNQKLLDLSMQEAKERYNFDDKRFFSTLKNRGYSGPPAILITLDDLQLSPGTKPGDVITSVVTESSKWMNAGFYFKHF